MIFNTCTPKTWLIFSYAVACTLTFATGVLSDRIQKRSPGIIAGLTIALIGLILLYTLPKDRLAGVRYFGCVLFMSGAYCAFPGTLSWVCEYGFHVPGFVHMCVQS